MKNAPVVIEQGIAPAEGPGAVAQPQAIPTFTAPSAADIRARAAQLRDADLVEQFVAERASNSKNTQALQETMGRVQPEQGRSDRV